MIRMSRSGAGAPASAPLLRRLKHIVRRWHALCFALWGSQAACFYVKPIPSVDVNQPPIIIEPDEDPKEVVVRGDSVVLTIIASDPDGDVLDFEWPDLANTTYNIDVSVTGELTVCRVEILDLDDLDRDLVRALVTDGDRDNVVPVSFVLVDP